MNLSPDNRTTLETLLSSLNSGLSGSAAAPILQATLQAQQAQQQARTARYQQMASDVANMAGQGMTYGGVENYVDTMTRQPGVPGQFQGLIDSAFQGAELPASTAAQQYSHGLEAPQFNPNLQNQMQSPMYTQNPAANAMAYGLGTNQLLSAPEQGMLQAQAAMPAPAAPEESDMMGAINAQMTKMKAAQMSPEQIAAAVQSDPEVMGLIMENLDTFMLTHPDVIPLLAPGMPQV